MTYNLVVGLVKKKKNTNSGKPVFPLHSVWLSDVLFSYAMHINLKLIINKLIIINEQLKIRRMVVD